MLLRDPSLSRYGQLSGVPSPVNRMMAAFAADFREGIDLNLGVGYVNENTLPHELIAEALEQVLAQPRKYRNALNYGGSAGSANLLESLRRFYVQQQLGGVTEAALADREFVIGPNGATSLLESLAHLFEPGLVVTSDPRYYIYCELLERLGFRVLAVPEDEEGLDVERLEQRLQELGNQRHRVRFFYVVTVGNPTATLLSNRRRQALLECAGRLSRQLGRRVPVIFDKAYEELIHDPVVESPRSPFLEDEDGLAYEVGTLSKVLAPALRVGYFVGRPGRLLSAVVQRTSDGGFSASLLTQEIASYLLDHHLAEQLERVRAGYREKAVQTGQWLDQYLGKQVEHCSGGQAGFYLYLTLRDVETHERSPFFRHLARTTGDPEADGPAEEKRPRVSYLPGQFCVDPQGALVQKGKRQLRLSYGFEELPRIETALQLMGEAAEAIAR